MQRVVEGQGISRDLYPVEVVEVDVNRKPLYKGLKARCWTRSRVSQEETEEGEIL